MTTGKEAVSMVVVDRRMRPRRQRREGDRMDNVGQERSGAEEELRQLLLERVEAVRVKNPDPLDASQAEDVVTFEVMPP
jgi:hypothetical protein